MSGKYGGLSVVAGVTGHGPHIFWLVIRLSPVYLGFVLYASLGFEKALVLRCVYIFCKTYLDFLENSTFSPVILVFNYSFTL